MQKNNQNTTCQHCETNIQGQQSGGLTALRVIQEQGIIKALQKEVVVCKSFCKRLGIIIIIGVRFGM